MSRWFRSYADKHRNPKVARLSDSDFRLWDQLLCVASENDGIIPPLEDLKHLLNRRLDHLSSALKRLVEGRLIDALSEGYAPRNWNEKQYKSDTSTERVQKFRAKRNVSGNVSETPPETDTESETEEPPKPPKGGRSGKTLFPDDWELPAVADLPPQARACAEQWTPASYAAHGEEFANYWRSSGRMMKDWRLAWAGRVVRNHAAVLRAQKFDQAPPGPKDKASVDWEERARFYDRIGDADQAAECRRKFKPVSIGQVLPIAAGAGR